MIIQNLVIIHLSGTYNEFITFKHVLLKPFHWSLGADKCLVTPWYLLLGPKISRRQKILLATPLVE